MIKSSELKVFSLSLLCVSILTACGGGNSIFENQGGAKDDKSAKDGTVTSGEDGTTTTKAPAISSLDGKSPTVNKFLTEETADIGQQTGPIVASVKYGSDIHGAVKFDQPGYVSDVCNYDSSATCKINFDKLMNSDLINDEAKAKLKKIQERLERAKPRGIVDINGNFQEIQQIGRADFPNLTYPENSLISKDAGINKVDVLRKADGSKMPYGGTIGREFNGLMLFKSPILNKYIDGYARTPATAGWSYQTFAVFSNKAYEDNRDLNIGYQSFGQQTDATQIPTSDRATYTGISHAYYNTDQVTSHNRIDVDFKNHTVKYRTTDTPYLHTFEGGQHVITEKPGYAVSADAKIIAGHNEFQGTARTQDGNLNGTLQGKFYGDNVEEVGGVYGLSGRDSSGKVHYVGGFGAKR